MQYWEFAPIFGRVGSGFDLPTTIIKYGSIKYIDCDKEDEEDESVGKIGELGELNYTVLTNSINTLSLGYDSKNNFKSG